MPEIELVEFHIPLEERHVRAVIPPAPRVQGLPIHMYGFGLENPPPPKELLGEFMQAVDDMAEKFPDPLFHPIKLMGLFGEEVPKKEKRKALEKKQEAAPQNPPTIRQFLGFNKKGDLGVEVEIEGENLLVKNPFWLAKNDGSLRGGVEFILHHPLSLQESKEVIHSLKEELRKNKAIISFSFRTSIHVHVNILELTKEELVSFLYLSHILEDALVNYSGEERTGNRFCLRTKDAEDKFFQLKSFITAPPIKPFNEGLSKYTAINLASIANYGSIEFRSMRGTLDEEVLFPWLDVLISLRDKSKELSLKEISEGIKRGSVEVAQYIFGEHFSKFNYPDLVKDIEEAHCRLIEIPYLKIGM